MLTSNSHCSVPRLVKVRWCILASLVTACTLTDYSYLGASRNSTMAVGGQGGTNAIETTSQPPTAGAGGLMTVARGGSAFGGTSAVAGGTSNRAQGGGDGTSMGTGGFAQTTSGTVATGGKGGTGGGYHRCTSNLCCNRWGRGRWRNFQHWRFYSRVYYQRHPGYRGYNECSGHDQHWGHCERQWGHDFVSGHRRCLSHGRYDHHRRHRGHGRRDQHCCAHIVH